MLRLGINTVGCRRDAATKKNRTNGIMEGPMEEKNRGNATLGCTKDLPQTWFVLNLRSPIAQALGAQCTSCSAISIHCGPVESVVLLCEGGARHPQQKGAMLRTDLLQCGIDQDEGNEC